MFFRNLLKNPTLRHTNRGPYVIYYRLDHITVSKEGFTVAVTVVFNDIVQDRQ